MKKIYSLFLLFFLFITNSIASNYYDGSMQLSIGFENNYNVFESTNDTYTTNALSFNIKTSHLFGNNIFKAGLTFAMGLSTGKVIDTNILISDNTNQKNKATNGLISLGPSLGVYFINLIKFNFSPTFILLFDSSNYKDLSSLIFNYGLGLDFQLILFPKKHIAPVLGYKFIKTTSTPMRGIIFTNGYFDRIWSYKNEVYAGISFNW